MNQHIGGIFLAVDNFLADSSGEMLTYFEKQVKLVDIDGVSLLDKRGYLTICVSQVNRTIRSKTINIGSKYHHPYHHHHDHAALNVVDRSISSKTITNTTEHRPLHHHDHNHTELLLPSCLVA